MCGGVRRWTFSFDSYLAYRGGLSNGRLSARPTLGRGPCMFTNTGGAEQGILDYNLQ